jgi:AmmeMemoRadiSam system protein B
MEVFSLSILIAGVSPHPPLLIPEIGGREIRRVHQTKEALKTLSAEIAAVHPETVIIITPHGPMFRDTPVILAEEELEGDFSIFRAPGVKLSACNDLELVQALAEESSKENIDVIQLKKNMQGSLREDISLDHGVTVPLYYLQAAGTARRCVAITFTLLPYGDLFRFGQALQRAVSAVGRKVAVVASADLSHRLTRDAPAGYHPRGREFDAQVVEYLQGYHVEKLLAMDQELVSAAGECGLRSLIILLGSLSGLSVQPRILSYEGPFGVGYPVALLKLLTEKEEGKDG